MGFIASFLLFNVIAGAIKDAIPQTRYYDNLKWEVVSEQDLIKENDYTYIVYVKHKNINKFYVSFNVENGNFDGKEKITITNTKSKILFHYSDTIKPVVIVEEAIPNRFISLFHPKLYRYHFIVPQDKVVETYIE